MSRPTPETVHARTFPEVLAFLKAERELVQLREQTPTLFKRLEAIAVVYNATLDAAEKVVRERKVSCGPFELYQFTAAYDAKAFLEAVGKGEFLRLGGDIIPTERLVLDGKVFDALVAREKVSPEVAAKVLTYGPRYHKPGRIELP